MNLDHSKLSFIGMGSGKVMILISANWKNTRHSYYALLSWWMMYLRSLKPETEQYLNLLAIKLHGHHKGNLKNTVEDIVDYLTRGKGEHDLELYLKARSKLPNEALAPGNLNFLYMG